MDDIVRLKEEGFEFPHVVDDGGMWIDVVLTTGRIWRDSDGVAQDMADAIARTGFKSRNLDRGPGMILRWATDNFQFTGNIGLNQPYSVKCISTCVDPPTGIVMGIRSLAKEGKET